MNALTLFTVLALASPIFSQEAQEIKKQDKRGLLGLGYGGYHGGGLGFGGGYGGHGYLGGSGLSLGHNFASAAPAYSSHGYSSGYSAPLSLSHGYSGVHGAPLYSSSHRLGYSGLGLGHGFGHGFGGGLGYHGW